MPIISPTAISPHRIGKSGINWSSYWTTHAPTDLVLTVMSDSIQVDWTDAAEAANGLRVYVDGVENGTVAYGVETYTITGLTVNTEYVVSLVAYSGTNESTALTDTVTTPVIIAFADEADGALPVLTGATWAVATGKAVNTPTEGDNLITDGGLENWTSATSLTSWNGIQTASTTTNQESTTIHSGSNACRIDIDGAGSRGAIYQAPAITLNEFFITRLWARASAAAKILALRHDSQIAEEYIVNPDATAYVEYVRSGVRNVNAGWNLNLRTVGSASSSIYIDDVSLCAITKTTLFATTNPVLSDVQTKAYWNGKRFTWSGVIMNIDNVADPKNWVAFITNGSANNSYLLKSVNGVISQVVSTALTTSSNSQLIELRKSGTTYQQFINGVQVGADQTISDVTIVSNTIHGLFSTYADNTCDRFYCGENGDVIEVADGGTISDYYKYVSSGDTLSLAPAGTYTFAAAHAGFSTLPNGTAARVTKINGNGSTITGGAQGFYLNGKSYFELNDLTLEDQEQEAVYMVGGAHHITFNNVHGLAADIAGYFDCFKAMGCHDLEYNDCEAGPCTGVQVTCDGFEDWDNEDVTYNNCIAIGFQNGAEELNNGHGFETYAQAAGEICKRITYNNCHAYDCRIGFSCEGGPLSAAHENIQAINCTTATIDLYDASGVDGATLLVTAGTLTNRNGSVTEI